MRGKTMTQTISSADFLKSYGSIVQTALREPVSITNHGREHLVLLSAEEYRRLKQHDPVSLYPWELDDAALNALATSVPPVSAADFDHEVR
jgi:PHD/YefM family antitoxin component YafN of YafNO toxin-antitoxin module